MKPIWIHNATDQHGHYYQTWQDFRLYHNSSGYSLFRGDNPCGVTFRTDTEAKQVAEKRFAREIVLDSSAVHPIQG